MERLIFPVTKKEAEKKGIKYSSQKNKDALFPSRLRELREKKGISQATLAHDLGVSKSTIGLYETGDTLPDAKTLYDLAAYFCVSSDYLIGLSNVRNTSPSIRKICEITGLSERSCTNLMAIKHQTENDDVKYIHQESNNVINFLLESRDVYDAVNSLSVMIQYLKDSNSAGEKRWELLLNDPEKCKEMDERTENAIEELNECSLGHYLVIVRDQFAFNMEYIAKRSISQAIKKLFDKYAMKLRPVENDDFEK